MFALLGGTASITTESWELSRSLGRFKLTAVPSVAYRKPDENYTELRTLVKMHSQDDKDRYKYKPHGPLSCVRHEPPKVTSFTAVDMSEGLSAFQYRGWQQQLESVGGQGEDKQHSQHRGREKTRTSCHCLCLQSNNSLQSPSRSIIRTNNLDLERPFNYYPNHHLQHARILPNRPSNHHLLIPLNPKTHHGSTAVGRAELTLGPHPELAQSPVSATLATRKETNSNFAPRQNA